MEEVIPRSLRGLFSSLVFYGLCIPLVASPFYLGGEEATGLFLWESWILGLACLWACTQWGREGSSIRSMGWDPLLLLLFAWCVLSYGLSDYRFSSQIELVKLGIYALFLYMLLALLDRARLKVMLMAILLAAACQALLTFRQCLAGGIPRPAGSFLDPNFAGLFLFFGLVISSLWSLLPGGVPKKARFFLGLLGLGLLATALVNGSRSVGALVILFLGALVLGRKRGRWVLLACLLGAVLLPNLTRTRLLGFAETDVYAWQRVNIWRATVRIIGDHPWTGVGLGNLPDHTYPYNFPVESHPARYARRFTSAHNNFLQAAAELGIPGVILATLWLCRLAWAWGRGMRRVKEPDLRAALWMASGIVGGFLLQGVVMDNLRSPSLVLVVLSMLAAVRWVELESEENLEPPGWTRWWRGLRVGPSLGVMLSVPVATIVWPLLVLSPYLSWRAFLEAESLARQGRLAEAEGRLGKAIRLNSGQPYYWQLLADLKVARARQDGRPGELADGFKFLHQAVSLNPAKPDFYAHLSAVCRVAHELDPKKTIWLQQGVRYMEDAISRNPLNVFYRYERASLLMELGDADGAREELEKAVSLEPNFIRGHEALAVVYGALGRREEAERERRTVRYLTKRFRDWDSRNPYERLLFQSPEGTGPRG